MKTKMHLKYVREMNSSLILDVLKEKAPLSKYDISKITGLSAPAVSKIVNALMDVGFIKEAGVGESIGGRPPLLLDLNLECGFVIGVDIGNDNITSNVVDLLGNVISCSVTAMDINRSEFQIFDSIIGTISESIKKSGKDRSLLLGMGIGISGDIDTSKGIIRYASRLNLRNVPLKSIIENSFHIPAYIYENVRLLSFAENWYGAGKNYNHIACLRIGDDIGAGIIIDGRLYEGSGGKAGVNIGHMIVSPGGKTCTCGNKGCLQAYVSSSAIVSRAEELYNGNKTQLSGYPGKNGTALTVKHISGAASDGDSLSLKVMDETGMYLAIAISNIINCIDPEVVILGGGIAQSGDILLNPVRKHLKNITQFADPESKVIKSALGEKAFSVGAATYVLHQIFSSPKEFITRLNK